MAADRAGDLDIPPCPAQLVDRIVGAEQEAGGEIAEDQKAIRLGERDLPLVACRNQITSPSERFTAKAVGTLA